MINQKRIRTLLRRTENKFISVSSVMQLLKLDKKMVLEFLHHMEEQGYIEKSDVDNGYWVMSMRGKVLVGTILPKEFKANTLQKHVDNLLERAQIVNTSAKFPLLITCIKIISPYPIEHRGTGVTIAYTLNHKPITKKEYDAVARNLRKEHKGAFGNISQKYGYPYTAVESFLKSASKVLKMRSYTTDEIKKLEGYIVFGEE